MDQFDLNRFLQAQSNSYSIALNELRNGRKDEHWIWYIFPQLKELGRSFNAQYYGIDGLAEAKAYIAHPILRQRLIEVCEAILIHTDKSAYKILGGIDAKKLCSSMTLFRAAAPEIEVFDKVLQQFYSGKADKVTLELLNM